MRYKMLAIDLDGTLFDSSGCVPKRNIEAVHRAADAGMLVALCTGRSLCEASKAIETLNHTGAVVLAGGAFVADPTTGRTLHRAVIEPTLVRQIIEHLAAMDHAVLILLDPDPADYDYLVINGDRLTENTMWWFNSIGVKYRRVDQADEHDLHHVLRVGMVGDVDLMPPIQQSIEQHFGDRVFVQHFTAVKQEDGHDVNVLEIFASGVSKWSALQWLAEEHGIDEQHIAAIGDHINDLPMISFAGCGIAMANAVEPILCVAKHVTTDNNAAGVADAIDHLLANRW